MTSTTMTASNPEKKRRLLPGQAAGGKFAQTYRKRTGARWLVCWGSVP